MSKLVGVTLGKSGFVVVSWTQAPAGFWNMNGYFMRLPVDVEAEVLGDVVTVALDQSNRLAIPDVKAGAADPFAAMLMALGLKTNTAYMRGTRSAGARLGDDGILKVTPERNEGARGGFVPIVEKARSIEDLSPASVGRAVQQAMLEAEA